MSRLSRLRRDVRMAETAAAAREDLDVHDADLHSGVADPAEPHEHDGTVHVHILDNPYRSGDGGATADRIEREWTPLLHDLLELEEAGALSGIRAIVAERLNQVRTDAIKDAIPFRLAWYRMDKHHGMGEYLDDVIAAAALLAAEIDRRQAGTGN